MLTVPVIGRNQFLCAQPRGAGSRLSHFHSYRSYTPLLAVVLGKSDLIDKLGVAVLPSIPFRADIVRSFDRVFRFLPEPCGASARDPRTPPSTRCSAALRQATETDTGGSVTLGFALRRLERLAVQHLCRQGRDRHRLAPKG